MPALFRLAAGGALISSTAAWAIGAIPSQTIGGYGEPFFAAPTEAPEYELVKVKLAKKSVTNVCTEWTIPGGEYSIDHSVPLYAGTDYDTRLRSTRMCQLGNMSLHQQFWLLL